LGPYSASNTTLATMVGSANGRSITASTSRLPGKSSRTSTQATSIPKNTLIKVTPEEIVSVTRNDSSADGDVTADTNAAHPPLADCHTIAASGSSTITDSHSVATPIRSAVVPRRAGGNPPVTGSVSSGLTASGFGSSAAVIQSPVCRSS
jgi:hypothetical protein